MSAFKGDLAYLQMIVETGVASINERDDRNSTPLHKGMVSIRLDGSRTVFNKTISKLWRRFSKVVEEKEKHLTLSLVFTKFTDKS